MGQGQVTLVEHFRAMARNNAWSNDRLLTACAELTQDEIEATRVGFFPSLQRTLNHILLVDEFFLAFDAARRAADLPDIHALVGSLGWSGRRREPGS